MAFMTVASNLALAVSSTYCDRDTIVTSSCQWVPRQRQLDRCRKSHLGASMHCDALRRRNVGAGLQCSSRRYKSSQSEPIQIAMHCNQRIFNRGRTGPGIIGSKKRETRLGVDRRLQIVVYTRCNLLPARESNTEHEESTYGD